MNSVEIGGDVGGLLVADLGGLFSCKGKKGEMRKERVHQIVY